MRSHNHNNILSSLWIDSVKNHFESINITFVFGNAIEEAESRSCHCIKKKFLGMFYVNEDKSTVIAESHLCRVL